jgi:hypothetical protein
MRFFAMAAFAALLSGCATRAELAAADDEQCRTYGAQPGTSAYVGCRTQLDSGRTIKRAIIAASP